MSADERLLNLVFVLVNSKRPLLREELRNKVGRYDPHSSDEAFQRMFERDKEALRKSGVLLESRPVDPGFNDALGYVIDSSKFFLPDLKLDTQDRVILAEASKVWKDAQLAKLAEDAASKIAVIDGDQNHQTQSEAFSVNLGLSLNQENAITIFEAIDHGIIVQFDYLTKGDLQPKARTVEPWQILLSGGHWYLVGFDHTRQEQRTFKLARFKSDVTVTDMAITHFKPADFDILRVVSFWRQSQDGTGLATVHAVHRHAGTLRLQADTIESADKYDVLTIRYANEEILARDIAAVIDQVASVEPQSLRQEVTRIIRDTKHGHQS
jgi:proteasome accessory factor B